MGLVVRDVEQLWFGYTLPVDTFEKDVTVGTSAVKLVDAKSRRAKLQLSHFGGANIAIGTHPDVTATTGIQFSPGQTAEFDWQDDYDRVTEEFWAISAVAGNSVHVVETVMTGAPDDGSAG